MRYIEVLKSRGSPHIQIPSIYFMGEGGLRVMPPFQEPFYRFEEAASTGIPQLDDLLGGGIPYGSFYLMEIDVDIHQDIFDAGFAKEALEAGDRYVRIAAQSDARSRWRALLKTAGLEEKLLKGLKSGAVTFFGCQPEETGGEVPLCQPITEDLGRICQQVGESNARFQVNVSRLFAFMSAEEANASFTSLTSSCRGGRSVVLGTVSPQGFPAEQLEKLRAAADGIVRVWSEGSYTFIQVVKTVNSARTPVYLLTQIPRPPFIEIMAQ
jgi:circadian clock protein KaiC